MGVGGGLPPPCEVAPWAVVVAGWGCSCACCFGAIAAGCCCTPPTLAVIMSCCCPLLGVTSGTGRLRSCGAGGGEAPRSCMLRRYPPGRRKGQRISRIGHTGTTAVPPFSRGVQLYSCTVVLRTYSCTCILVLRPEPYSALLSIRNTPRTPLPGSLFAEDFLPPSQSKQQQQRVSALKVAAVEWGSYEYRTRLTILVHTARGGQ
jgi:hypothetical protein